MRRLSLKFAVFRAVWFLRAPGGIILSKEDQEDHRHDNHATGEMLAFGEVRRLIQYNHSTAFFSKFNTSLSVKSMRSSSRQLRLSNFLLYSFPSKLHTFIGPLYSHPPRVNNILAQLAYGHIALSGLAAMGTVSTSLTPAGRINLHTVHVCVRQC